MKIAFLFLAFFSVSAFANCEVYFYEKEGQFYYDPIYEDSLGEAYYGDRLPSDGRFLEPAQNSGGYFYDGNNPDSIDGGRDNYDSPTSFNEPGSNTDF